MKNVKQILQLVVVRHSYKFFHKLEIGIMILIFKVNYQNAMLATKLPFKTNRHLAVEKKNQPKKIYLLFTAMRKTEISVVVFQCDVWECQSAAYTGRWCRWKGGHCSLTLDVP